MEEYIVEKIPLRYERYIRCFLRDFALIPRLMMYHIGMTHLYFYCAMHIT